MHQSSHRMELNDMISIRARDFWDDVKVFTEQCVKEKGITDFCEFFDHYKNFLFDKREYLLESIHDDNDLEVLLQCLYNQFKGKFDFFDQAFPNYGISDSSDSEEIDYLYDIIYDMINGWYKIK